MKLASNQVVLITGCGSGIGKALARAFRQQGYTVCATARRIDTLNDLQAEGIMTWPLDVTSASAIDDIRAHLHQQGLSVGVLVNNAGYGAMGPLLDVPASEWQRQFDVNVFAPIALTRALLPDMIARGCGTVVNISSVSGVLPTPFAGPYCASKAAFNTLSDALRMEVAPLGIRVVTVQPGGIRSGFGDNAASQVCLAPDSPYQAIRDGVMARANESQGRSMPAEEFAARVVEQLQRSDCPAVIRLGPKSRLMPWLKQWLPTPVLDRLLSKRFRLHKLSRAGTPSA